MPACRVYKLKIWHQPSHDWSQQIDSLSSRPVADKKQPKRAARLVPLHGLKNIEVNAVVKYMDVPNVKSPFRSVRCVFTDSNNLSGMRKDVTFQSLNPIVVVKGLGESLVWGKCGIMHTMMHSRNNRQFKRNEASMQPSVDMDNVSPDGRLGYRDCPRQILCTMGQPKYFRPQSTAKQPFDQTLGKIVRASSSADGGKPDGGFNQIVHFDKP